MQPTLKFGKCIVYLVMISEMIDFDMFLQVCIVIYFLDTTFISPYKIPFIFTESKGKILLAEVTLNLAKLKGRKA